MTTAREVLLEAMGEDEFSQVVKRWAYRANRCGIHIRYSQAVVEGIHTFKNSDHSDAFGFPDWIFAKQDTELLIPELKRMGGGNGRPDQRRWIRLLDSSSSVSSRIWRPDMADEIQRELAG